MAPSIGVSFLSTPDRGPTPRRCGSFRFSTSELESRRGFAATITVPCVPSIATFATLVGRSGRHRSRHPCTPAPLLTVPALPRCQTQLFDFCNTSNDTRARLRSDARIPVRLDGVTHPSRLQTIRLGEWRSRATTVCNEPPGLISMLRIASKQPHPKKRTPVPFPFSRRPFPAREGESRAYR